MREQKGNQDNTGLTSLRFAPSASAGAEWLPLNYVGVVLVLAAGLRCRPPGRRFYRSLLILS
jgi:hypothetical protein